jgi:carbamoyltransferase
MKNNQLVTMGLTNGHDRGCAIMYDGKLAVAINEERLSRIKRDDSPQLATKSIQYCMDYLGLTNSEIDFITYTTTDEVDVLRSQIEEYFPELVGKIKFIPHHLAHAFSTFGGSDFEDAAVVVADAMGSILSEGTEMGKWYSKDEETIGDRHWAEAYTIYHFKGRKGEYKDVYKKWIQFPFIEDAGDEVETSVGFYYGMGALQLIYDENTHSWPAGKLMGLASYANKDWVAQQPEYSERTEDDLKITANHIWPWIDSRADFQSKADIAGLYQREQELNSMHLVKLAKKFTGSDNVCVAGGSFLNCNTNELIIKSDLFEGQYFVPPSDDSGISIGCAMYAATEMGSELDNEGWMKPYGGKVYSDEEIEAALTATGYEFTRFKTIEETAEAAAQLVAGNKVIGWFQGGSEMGPRALGNRSIIANPGTAWMEEYINSEIKKREWYRPFAPSVLKERVAEIFDLEVFSPYMLVTTEVKPEWRDRIPAVTHIDGTSRYQSVDPEWNYPYYTLISKFNEITGVPVVLNTSFNGPSEPIVESPTDAINTMFREGLKAVFIGNYMITQ